VYVPISAALLWLLSLVVMDWHGAVLGSVAIFVALMFPAMVTLLIFEANCRLGPTVARALGNLAPLFALLLRGARLEARFSLAVVLTVAGAAILIASR
jgi:hypothetical protein